MKRSKVSDAALLSMTSLLLMQCGEPEPSLDDELAAMDAEYAAIEADIETAQPMPPPSDTDLARICRAGIADIGGHSPSIVKVTSNTNGIVQTRYARPSDGKIWKNECRIEGDRVIWRTVDAFGSGSGTGRWRTHPDDEVITYELDGPKVTITTTYSDGSSGSETYTIR